MTSLKKNKARLNIVGIMSGTSFDGVDFVFVTKTKGSFKYKDMSSVSYPKKLKNRLMDLAEGAVSFREAQALNFELGNFYSNALKKIKTKRKWRIDLIGLHGQTVFHNPPSSTLQIGEPSYLKSFGVPVVSDFRSKIVAEGGEGAPLAPIFHNEVMKNEKNWGFLNLGGMSNLTLKKNSKLFASDLGPGNVFLDEAMRILYKKEFDKGGAESLKGIPDLSIVKKFCSSHKFIKKTVPKSCGREDFSKKDLEELLVSMKKLSATDIMATLCEITLYPILKELKKSKIKTLVVSGGGALNNYFMKRFEEDLNGSEVITSDDLGWPTQSVEGAAFALLAAYKIEDKSCDLSYMKFKKKLSPLGRVD